LKTIFLVAKYLAIQSDAESEKQIKISDIQEAFNFLHITKSEVLEEEVHYYESIQKPLRLSGIKILAGGALDIAEKAPTVKFDDDVKLFKKHMDNIKGGRKNYRKKRRK